LVTLRILPKTSARKSLLGFKPARPLNKKL
jgi:hypothetical protein